MSAQPTNMTTLTEPNVPEEVFDMLFRDFGTVPGAKGDSPGRKNGKMLAIDINNSDREIWISKRLIREQQELDALCQFQTVDKRRARGAAFLLPSGGGCSVLIPPFTATHYRCSDGEQKLVLKFGHALLNCSARLYLPGDQNLDLEVLSPSSTSFTDPKDRIMEIVSGYPSQLQRCGVSVPDDLLQSAGALWEWHEKERSSAAEEQRVHILEQWASTATKTFKVKVGRSKCENTEDSPRGRRPPVTKPNSFSPKFGTRPTSSGQGLRAFESLRV